MDPTRSTVEFQANLANLQAASFKVIAVFALVIGYVWLVPNLWRPGQQGGVYITEQIIGWLGNALLLGSTIVALLLWKRNLSLAAHVLVWGILAAILCAVLSIASPVSIFLLVLPILFASVLLSRRGFVLIAVLAGTLAIIISLVRVPLPDALNRVFLPALIMVLVILGSWLSTHNLYMALAWIWDGYERARRNEQLARARQAELSRALKSLDEAHYRLERANYMLSAAYDRAEEARRLKQQFAQTISHELRTPLNLIVGFTEVMTRSPEYYGGQLSPAYVRDLRIVYRNARHLQTLVNDVLDLARIEAAQMGIMPEKTDPARLVREVVETARGLVEGQGLALRVDLAPDLPHLWLDPTRIRQVLFNLLNNAARFTEDGSITVRAWQGEDEVCFAVADTGVGIAPEHLDRIFEEFHQIDGSTRRQHRGTGLGLAISKRFVELHKGRMWVESAVGEGSVFSLCLPLNRVALEDAGAPGPTAATHVEREDAILLVVTPHLPAATLLTRSIQSCRTVVAVGLDQARAMARQLLPQAVVIDRRYDLAEPGALEDFARSCGLPQALFMLCPLSGEAASEHDLDVQGYLTKPLSRQTLWDALRQLGEEVNKLLIIDDDDDFVQLLGRMLDTATARRRYQVINAYTAREGLTLMWHHQPDAVLLDLGLPDMSGLEVLGRMRATPDLAATPVVVITGQDVMEDQGVLHGRMTLSKAEGLAFAEVVHWIQAALALPGMPSRDDAT